MPIQVYCGQYVVPCAEEEIICADGLCSHGAHDEPRLRHRHEESGSSRSAGSSSQRPRSSHPRLKMRFGNKPDSPQSAPKASSPSSVCVHEWRRETAARCSGKEATRTAMQDMDFGALQEHDKNMLEDIEKENAKVKSQLLEALELAKLAGAVVMVSSEDQDMLHDVASAEGRGRGVAVKHSKCAQYSTYELRMCGLVSHSGVLAKLLSVARMMTLVLLCCDHVVSP